MTELNSRECVLSRGAALVCSSGVKRDATAALPQFIEKLDTLTTEEGKSTSTWAMIVNMLDAARVVEEAALSTHQWRSRW